MKRLRRVWSLFFLVAVAGVPSGAAFGVLYWQRVVDISALTLRDDVRGSLYGALVSAASFLLAIMLAVLAVITTLDERPIMTRWKSAPRSYQKLIDALLGPVFTTLMMGAMAVVCIALPSSSAGSRASVALVSVVLGLSVASFIQAAYVGWLLTRMLLTAASNPTPPARDPDVSEETYEKKEGKAPGATARVTVVASPA